MKKRKIITAVLAIAILAALAVGASAASVGTGVVTASWINFREGPSLGATVIDVYKRGTKVEVLSEQPGGWYEVKYGDKVGYMYAKYVDLPAELNFKPGKAAITGDGVRLRTGPSLTSGVITYLYRTEYVQALALEGEWYKVDYNGKVGYVFGKYVKLLPQEAQPEPTTEPEPTTPPEPTTSPEPTTPPEPTTSPEPTTPPEPTTEPGTTTETGMTVGEKIVEEALKYLGYPYVYGGSSETGYDCSGFTYFMFYKQFGFEGFNRTASSQWHNGVQVTNKSDLKLGDLVFFSSNYSSSIEHVGIYVGNDQFIHSSSSKGSVILSNMTDWYYTTYYYGAIRVPGTELPYAPAPAATDPAPETTPEPTPTPSPAPAP